MRDGSGTRREARATSVVSRGCRGAFPSVASPRCSESFAWFDHSPVPLGCLCAAGVGGAGGCPSHKSPLKAASWVVVGNGALLGGSSRAVFYSHRAAEGCPPKVLPKDSSAGEQWASLAVVTASGPPGDETEQIQHPAAAVALRSEAPGLVRAEIRPQGDFRSLLELSMSW